jgi:hypothetical protein
MLAESSSTSTTFQPRDTGAMSRLATTYSTLDWSANGTLVTALHEGNRVTIRFIGDDGTADIEPVDDYVPETLLLAD